MEFLYPEYVYAHSLYLPELSLVLSLIKRVEYHKHFQLFANAFI